MTDFSAYRDSVKTKLLSTVGACGSTGLRLSALHRTFQEDWDEQLTEVMKKLNVRTIDDLIKLFDNQFRIFGGAMYAQMDEENGSLHVFELIVGSEGNKKPERERRSHSVGGRNAKRPNFRASGANFAPIAQPPVRAIMPPNFNKRPPMKLAASQPVRFVPGRVQSMVTPRPSCLASSSPKLAFGLSSEPKAPPFVTSFQQKSVQTVITAQEQASNLVTPFKQKAQLSSSASRQNLASSSPQLRSSGKTQPVTAPQSARPRVISTDMIRRFLPKPIEADISHRGRISSEFIRKDDKKPLATNGVANKILPQAALHVDPSQPTYKTTAKDKETNYQKHKESRASWAAQPLPEPPKIATALEKQRSQWQYERIARILRNHAPLQKLKTKLSSVSNLNDVTIRNSIVDNTFDLIALASQYAEDVHTRSSNCAVTLELLEDQPLHQMFKDNIDAGKISV